MTRTYAMWTPSQDARLTSLRAEGMTYAEIGEELGRTGKSCDSRAEWLRRTANCVRKTSPWTPEAKAKVTAMYLAGKSAREIALVMRGVTRNAVIGALHRMGVARVPGQRTSTTRVRIRAAKPAKPKTLKQGIRMKPAELRPATSKPIKPDVRPLRCVPIESRRVPLMDLVSTDCRYPDTDPNEAGDITFCGQRNVHGSWCLGHQMLVFTPANDKRKASTLNDLLRLAKRAA